MSVHSVLPVGNVVSIGIQTNVPNYSIYFIFVLNQSKNHGSLFFRNVAQNLEQTLRNIPEYCHIILLTYPPLHLLFHEGHEKVKQSIEGWFHVDMIHAFGTNRVAVLEQRIYLHDHFRRTTITTNTLIIYVQYVNIMYVMKLK